MNPTNEQRPLRTALAAPWADGEVLAMFQNVLGFSSKHVRMQMAVAGTLVLLIAIAGVDTFKLYDREHLVIDDAEGTSLKTDLTLFTSVRSMRIQSTWSLKQGKGSSEWRRAGRVEPWLLPLRVLLLHRHAR